MGATVVAGAIVAGAVVGGTVVAGTVDVGTVEAGAVGDEIVGDWTDVVGAAPMLGPTMAAAASAIGVFDSRICSMPRTSMSPAALVGGPHRSMARNGRPDRPVTIAETASSAVVDRLTGSEPASPARPAAKPKANPIGTTRVDAGRDERGGAAQPRLDPLSAASSTTNRNRSEVYAGGVRANQPSNRSSYTGRTTTGPEQ